MMCHLTCLALSLLLLSVVVVLISVVFVAGAAAVLTVYAKRQRANQLLHAQQKPEAVQ